MYYMLESERSTETMARLLTKYMKTDGKCVELYYWIRGGSRLELKIRGENYIESYVVIKNDVSESVRSFSFPSKHISLFMPSCRILF